MSPPLLAIIVTLMASPSPSSCFALQQEVIVDAGSNSGDMASGDFNADGLADLAVVNRQSRDVAILLGTRAGTLAGPTFIRLSYETQNDIAAADFDADGRLDLLVPMNDSVVEVLLGNGDGTFRRGNSYDAEETSPNIVAGDFDRDGRMDVILQRQRGFELAAQSAAGHLFPRTFVPLPGDSPFVSAIAHGDFDGDRNLDVVATEWFTRTAWFFFGRGDGTFVAAASPVVTTSVAGHHPSAIAAGDLDGDGRDDVAVVHRDPTARTQPAVVVIRSRGDRTFGEPVVRGALDHADDVLIRDVDRNGTADIIAAGQSLAVIHGRGDGTFEPQIDHRGASPGFLSFFIGVAVLDIDGDGILDVAGSRFIGGYVGIFRVACGRIVPAVSVPAMLVLAALLAAVAVVRTR